MPADPSNPLLTTTFLPLEFATRVRAERSTPNALDAGTLWAYGQVVAFVRIPVAVVPGAYEIEVYRYWRDSDGDFEKRVTSLEEPPNWQEGDWKGWDGATQEMGIPIEIAPCPSTPCTEHYSGYSGTPIEDRWTGWVLFGYPRYYANYVRQADLAYVTPLPFLRLWPSGAAACVAAWDLEIEYPIEKFLIKGVSHYGNSASEVYVHGEWDETPPDPECDDMNVDTDLLRIQVMAPDCGTAELGIAFELRPESFAGCGEGIPAGLGRAVPADFEVIRSEAYGQGGQLISVTENLDASFM